MVDVVSIFSEGGCLADGHPLDLLRVEALLGFGVLQSVIIQTTLTITHMFFSHYQNKPSQLS